MEAIRMEGIIMEVLRMEEIRSAVMRLETEIEIEVKLIKLYFKAFENYMPARSNNLAVSDTAPKGGLRIQRMKKCLPMFLNGLRYDTTPDTGSQENAISVDEARRLGLKTSGRDDIF
jgi:hypothetical protein